MDCDTKKITDMDGLWQNHGLCCNCFKVWYLLDTGAWPENMQFHKHKAIMQLNYLEIQGVFDRVNGNGIKQKSEKISKLKQCGEGV